MTLGEFEGNGYTAGTLNGNSSGPHLNFKIPPKDLSFTDYQLATQETAVYPEVGTGSQLAIAYVGLGLGEAGEVQGKIKKILRDDNGEVTDEKRKAIAKELGDILWYVSQTANELDLSLELVAQGNLDKLADRKNRGVITGSGDDR